jgi:drug/metabolite transporter (DMT)-like permease
MTRRTYAYLSLTLVAAMFGVTFVFVKSVLDVIPPLAFVGWRFLIGAVVLFVVGRPWGRAVWRDGTIAGVALFIGYATQTIGLELTSATNSGLITGLYVVFTPLIAAIARRTSPAIATIAGASMSIIGLGALTITNTFTLEAGDVWTLVCAVAFAFHIVILAYLAPRHKVLPFTAVQLGFVALAALVLSAIVDGGLPIPSAEAWPTLIITGLLVTAGAFLMQVWSQRIIGPSRTAIILAVEPLFAVITAALVLSERLDARGWIGAALMIAGTYVVLVFAPPEDADIRTAEAVSEAH